MNRSFFCITDSLWWVSVIRQCSGSARVEHGVHEESVQVMQSGQVVGNPAGATERLVLALPLA